MSDLTELITGLPCFKAPSNITPLGGGITNTNVTVEDEDCKYVVRIGSDIAEHGVMRWNELALSQAAYKLGISPKVIYHKTGVLVLEFIECPNSCVILAFERSCPTKPAACHVEPEVSDAFSNNKTSCPILAR